MGRTPGAKNKPKDGEEFDIQDNTEIQGEGTPKKERQKSVPIAKEIIADKINIISETFASLLGYEYNYKAEDYKKEAIALNSLAKDNKIVAKVLEFFDPVVLVCGMYVKFRNLKRKPKQQKEQPKPEQNPVNQQLEQNQEQSKVFSLVR